MGVWIAVAVGGAIGSVARHAVNHLVHVRWLTTRFPAGTVVVNVTGCFLIGLLTGLIVSNRLTLRFFWREFVFVGMLGGFTTFSTFGLDTRMLVQTHSSEAALANVAANMIGGLAAVWIGYAVGVRT
jgi:fluoride exporter